MKSILFTLLVLSSPFASAAVGFDLVMNGEAYRCEPGATDPGVVLECANIAYKGPFSQADATALCTGATSTGPALCAIKAYSGPFNTAQSIQLCRQIGTIAHAECAIRAYAGPYSADEAVKLCRGGDLDLLMRTFDIMESSADSQNQIRVIKARSTNI